jgi:hypothetical protein
VQCPDGIKENVGDYVAAIQAGNDARSNLRIRSGDEHQMKAVTYNGAFAQLRVVKRNSRFGLLTFSAGFVFE